MASKLKFKYEIIDLIESVESYQCIWDKTCEDYKNKRLKEKAWKAVCRFLEKDYDSMDDTQQKAIGKISSFIFLTFAKVMNLFHLKSNVRNILGYDLLVFLPLRYLQQIHY